MSKGSVISIIALSAVGVALLFFSITSYMGKENEKVMRLSIERHLEDIEATKILLEKDLSEIKAIKAELEQKLAGTEQQNAALMGQLDEAKKSTEAALEEIAKREKEYETMKTELDSEKTVRMDLEYKLKVAQQYYAELEDVVLQLKKEKSIIQEQLANERNTYVNDSIPLDRIIVEAQPLAGKVKVVNGEHNFIIIDIGNNQGVKEGMLLGVRRGDTYLGRVQIEKVYEDMSAAAILSRSIDGPIREGDVAVLEQ